MANDNGSLSHTKWNCKYHIVFAAAGGILTNQGRYRKDNQAAMRDEESGNHRGRSMPGSYPYVSEHTAKYQRIAVCGISKGKKFIDDIRQTCELEVQVWDSTFLVPGVLCGHGGTEQKENCRIHPAPAGRGYHGGPAVIQGVHRPVYG